MHKVAEYLLQIEKWFQDHGAIVRNVSLYSACSGPNDIVRTTVQVDAIDADAVRELLNKSNRIPELSLSLGQMNPYFLLTSTTRGCIFIFAQVEF